MSAPPDEAYEVMMVHLIWFQWGFFRKPAFILIDPCLFRGSSLSRAGAPLDGYTARLSGNFLPARRLFAFNNIMIIAHPPFHLTTRFPVLLPHSQHPYHTFPRSEL